MKLDSKTYKYLEDKKLNLGETSDRFLKLKEKVLQNEASKIIKTSKKNKPKKIKSYPIYKKFKKLKHSTQDRDTLNYIYEVYSKLSNKPISNITIKDLVLRFNKLELQNNQDKTFNLLKKKKEINIQIKNSYNRNRYKFALNNINQEIKTLDKGIVELYRYRKMLEEIIKHSIKVRNQITKITPLIQEEDLKIQNTETLIFNNKEFKKITFYSTGSIEMVRVIL